LQGQPDWSTIIAEEQEKQTKEQHRAEKEQLELLLLQEEEAQAKLAEQALLEEAQRDLAGFHALEEPFRDLASTSPDRSSRAHSPRSPTRSHTSGSLSPSGQPPHVILICDPSQLILARRIVDILSEEGFQVMNISDFEGLELTPKQTRRLAEDFLQARVLLPLFGRGFFLSDLCMSQLGLRYCLLHAVHPSTPMCAFWCRHPPSLYGHS